MAELKSKEELEADAKAKADEEAAKKEAEAKAKADKVAAKAQKEEEIARDTLVLRRNAFLRNRRFRTGTHDVTGLNLKVEDLPPDATLNGEPNPSWAKRRAEASARVSKKG